MGKEFDPELLIRWLEELPEPTDLFGPTSPLANFLPATGDEHFEAVAKEFAAPTKAELSDRFTMQCSENRFWPAFLILNEVIRNWGDSGRDWEPRHDKLLSGFAQTLFRELLAHSKDTQVVPHNLCIRVPTSSRKYYVSTSGIIYHKQAPILSLDCASSEYGLVETKKGLSFFRPIPGGGNDRGGEDSDETTPWIALIILYITRTLKGFFAFAGHLFAGPLLRPTAANYGLWSQHGVLQFAAWSLSLSSWLSQLRPDTNDRLEKHTFMRGVKVQLFALATILMLAESQKTSHEPFTVRFRGPHLTVYAAHFPKDLVTSLHASKPTKTAPSTYKSSTVDMREPDGRREAARILLGVLRYILASRAKE